jgi:hypothetical protein
MKKLIIAFTIFFSFSIAHAKDIQLFNPEIFGQPTSNAVKPLHDKVTDEIEPYMVTTDIKCGKYYAASIYYSKKKVTFAEARESLNKLYNGLEKISLFQESKIAIWRVEKKWFSIQLVQEEDGICIRYVQFQPTSNIFQGVMKVIGADTDAIYDNECK